MKTTPRQTAAEGATRILVWDWPTRLFHWTLAGSFAGAWLTAESERLALWHMSFGLTLLGLIGFRLLWGVAGTRHARFGSFLAGPAKVWRYLRSLASAEPEHYIGHNPAGAVAVLLLLLLGAATAVTGVLYWQEIGGEAFEEVHEALATTLLGVVGLHVAGVIFSSLRHRENLVGAMLSGFKRGQPGEGIARSRPLVALLLAGVLAGFWGYAWSPASFLRGGPEAPEAVAATASRLPLADAGDAGARAEARRDDEGEDD
ncbi:MAG: cytochrome b/b6 domain-containing protein [Pseudomonadota bacterium]